VIDLLSTFRTERRQMAAIIDEWGAFEGLVTVEDLLEVVVGDLRDEFDPPGAIAAIERDGDGYLVDGGVPTEELGAELDADFDAGEFGTVGGLVLGELGRPPEIGDAVSVSGYRLTVESIDGARVTSVSVRRADDRGEEGGVEGGDDQ
jgi:CBS domain containing-hemolysin-like protein